MDVLADSYVSEKESIEFMLEGLKQAASAARQLASAQQHEIWRDIGLLLDEMHNTSIQLANARSIGRQKTLQIIERREKFMSKELENKRSVKKSKFLLN